MNKNRIAKLIIAVFIIFFVGCVISIPIVNDCYARGIENQLKKIELPEQTEQIESISIAGKLTGNGNGMQYFGAILIKSDLSIEEVKSHYQQFRQGEWDCLVTEITENNIEEFDIGTYRFSTDINGPGYYMVYTWGNGPGEFFEQLDIRGH